MMKKVKKTVALTLLVLMVSGASYGEIQAEKTGMKPQPVKIDTSNFTGGMFDLYANNRKQKIANYITEDFILLSYSLLNRTLMERAERDYIKPQFDELLYKLDSAVRSLKDNKPETIANQAFIQVLLALASDDASILTSELASQEYKSIMAADGISMSALWQQNIDYSQFKPRGRYTRTAELQAYFRAMRYAGSVLFAMQPSAATGVTPQGAERMTRQAMQLVEIMSDKAIAANRNKLESLRAWRFGHAEDLTDQDLSAFIGKPVKPANLIAYARDNGRQPQITAGVVDLSKLEAGITVKDVMTGWRLLPSRYTSDSAAFQRLVYNATGEYTPVKGRTLKQKPFGLGNIGGKSVKAYPLAKELLAAMQSSTAVKQLENAGEMDFEGYTEAMLDVSKLLDNAAGLNGEQLDFMKASVNASVKDAERRQNSLVSFWTWQRYLSLLYTKQSYTLGSKSITLDSRNNAVLEPATVLYTALKQLVAMHQKHNDSEEWQAFAEIIDSVLQMSQQLDAGKVLTPGQHSYLNQLDKKIKLLVGETDKPIVVDVHTNPDENKVLEQGIGYARAVVKNNARGALFRHYEFKHDMSDRLTDESWQALLKKQLSSAEPISIPEPK